MSTEDLIARLQAAEAKIAELTAVKEPKAKKPKEKGTKAPPSQDWNIFVLATYKEMAASAGVLYDSFIAGGDAEGGHKAFLAAAKAAGVIYRDVMQEAGKRRDEASGMDDAAKAAKIAKKEANRLHRAQKVADKKAGIVKEPKAKEPKAKEPRSKAPKMKKVAFEALPSDAPEDAEKMAEFHKDLLSAEMDFKIIDGVRYIVCNDGEVYEIDDCEMGESVGIYDATLQTIVPKD